jgi:hypothetical protein
MLWSNMQSLYCIFNNEKHQSHSSQGFKPLTAHNQEPQNTRDHGYLLHAVHKIHFPLDFHWSYAYWGTTTENKHTQWTLQSDLMHQLSSIGSDPSSLVKKQHADGGSTSHR